jgi:hypothetical protein
MCQVERPDQLELWDLSTMLAAVRPGDGLKREIRALLDRANEEIRRIHISGAGLNA